MAELIYYCGTMDSGKSTLALQTAHNHESRGRAGLLFTNRDRAGSGKISSRLGLTSEALEVSEEMDLHKFVVDQLSAGRRIDYVICDEAQFYAPSQIEQLARIADGLGIEVYAFGILTDFRTKLFPGSARLVELADRVHTLQVEALCWCALLTMLELLVALWSPKENRLLLETQTEQMRLHTKFYADVITCAR